MPSISSKHATCPRCRDTNQVYYFYVSWNSAFGESVPQIKNFCTTCGAEISDRDSGEVIYGASARNIDCVWENMD